MEKLKELAKAIKKLSTEELAAMKTSYGITIHPDGGGSGGDGDNDADDGAGGVHDGPNDV